MLSRYGLYAAVFSDNISRCMRVSNALDAGSVGVNCTGPTTTMDMPFGGYKASGVGRENGPHGLDPYLETKSVFVSCSKQSRCRREADDALQIKVAPASS